jgi:hypothetical protein
MMYLKAILKRFAPVALVVSCSVIPLNSAHAGKNGLGLGVIVGEPTGISLKFWNTNSSAIDGAIAWSIEGNDKLHLHADYLFHEFNVANVEKGQLPFYYGIGGRILLKEGRNSDDLIGVRIPVGVSYLFENSPLEFFLELVPILDLSPDTELDFNGGIGLRFYSGHKSRTSQ